MGTLGNTGELSTILAGGVVSLLGVVSGPLLITQGFEIIGSVFLCVGLLAGFIITSPAKGQSVEHHF